MSIKTHYSHQYTLVKDGKLFLYEQEQDENAGSYHFYSTNDYNWINKTEIGKEDTKLLLFIDVNIAYSRALLIYTYANTNIGANKCVMQNYRI